MVGTKTGFRWEAFDPAWMEGGDPHGVSMIGAEFACYGGYENSLRHGWSAGPVPWLGWAILGVRPAEPGFAAIHFCPTLGDLAWAKGTVPTPSEPIQVLLSSESGERVAKLVVPAGMEVGTPTECTPVGPDEPAETWQVVITRNP